MLREKSQLLTNIHRAIDVFLTMAAYVSAYFIKKYLLPESIRGLTLAPNYYVILLLVIIIWYISFNIFNLYMSYRRRSFSRIFWQMVKAVSVNMLILILCMYVLKITLISRIMLGIFFVMNILLLGLSKCIVYYLLAGYRKKGYNFRNVLIIGSRNRAREVIDIIGDQQSAGFRVLGCLDIDPALVGSSVNNGIKVIGTVDQLETIIKQDTVDEVIFAMPLKKIENVDRYISRAEEIGLSVRIVPDWQIHSLMYSPGIAAIRFEDFLGIPTMGLHTIPLNQGALLIKNLLDYLSAALGLIILLPVFGFIAAAIKISSKGPVFFKQERSGLNGRHFMLYKFRTMAADAEQKRKELQSMNETDGPVFKIRKDPRIIPYVDTILRKTGLDELPQLINVLRGEMSLVGPRPPIPDEVNQYDMWQRRRLSMKPGLTCLWQICPDRNEVTFNDWMKMDLKYIDNWSLGLDFKILFRTAMVVLACEGR